MDTYRGALAAEPARGTFAFLEHPWLLDLPGLSQLKRIQRGDIPPSPLWYASGLDFTDVGIGATTTKLPATGWLVSPAGFPTPGVLAFAADAALAGALQTTLGPATFLLTADLSLNAVGVPQPDGGAFIARATLIKATSAQGLTEATLEDAHGRFLAHATSRCMTLQVPADSLPPAPADDGKITWPDYDGAHPFQRPAEGAIVTQDVWDRLSGLEMLGAWQRGDLPRTPLSNFTGSAVEEFAPGSCTLSVLASRWFASFSGMLYGGALALFADYAMNAAVQTTVEAGTSWGPLDLKVNYLRPVPADGRRLELRARVVHRGRTIAVSVCDLIDAAGKTVAMAGSTTMLWPGQPWRALEAPSRFCEVSSPVPARV